VPIPLNKGRYLVVAWIAVFLAVAGVITLRDRAAFRTQETLRVVEESLQVVSRQHAELTADIANRLSAAVLTPLGESRGLRIPTDTEIETITVPGP
jgi:hypothetical protein